MITKCIIIIIIIIVSVCGNTMCYLNYRESEVQVLTTGPDED